jgi:predicted transcriptional regulator
MNDATTKKYVELIYEGLTLELETEIEKKTSKSSPGNLAAKADRARNIRAKQAIEEDLQSGDVESKALKAIVVAVHDLENGRNK